MPRKSKRRKEEICEDYCFRCKDGGAVRICDYKDCLKVYHPQCVEKDDSFLKSKDRWTCNRHSCFICQRIPKFYCFCCPQAVCGRCLCDAEFAVVKGSEGFCNHCLKLAIMIEENVDVDSDGGRVDFKERNTFEFLFMEYWEIIKEKHGLSSEQVYSAKDLLKNGENHTHDSDFDLNEISQEEESFTESDEESDDDNWKGREEYVPVGKKKRSKGNQCAMKRKAKATKIEFRGWGSKSLLEFLISIGKDTTKELSQNEVTTIVSNYCKEHNLFHPQKKKMVMCDPMLQSLLGKKSININRLYNLLDAHFAENLDLTEEDETGSSSEDNDKNLMVTCNRQPKLVSDRQPQKTNVVPGVRKTCFASIVAENIKLVYLKRSLVEELLKQPETFDEKVVGSFVRVKSDPNDYSQKNSYQLLQVKGTRKTSSNGEMNTEIFMQLVNMPKDVQVCELSNDDFCEEECKDLHQRVKEGKLKRPTVVELEQKARCLHKDIMERWIARELSLLQKRIDQANEKGWRRELEQYLDKKLLLEKPSEQFRLINEVPEVIADVEKLEPTPENSLSQDQTEHDGSPESAPRARWSSQTPRTGLANRTVYYEKGGTDPSEKFKPTPESSPRKDKQECDGFPDSAFKGSCPTPNTNLASGTLCLPNGGTDPAEVRGGIRQKEHQFVQVKNKSHKVLFSEEFIKKPLDFASQGKPDIDLQEPHHFSSGVDIKRQSEECVEQKLKNESTSKAELIELSDDDEDVHDEVKAPASEDPDSALWHCMSPLGETRGPYKMSLLRQWNNSSCRPLKFKVWKEGQSEEEAVFLDDAVRQSLPNT
ncbi:uncharacterized protein At5g08430-like isoform X2 [Malus sylvestris]|uniref:uncharacterized protein At5g08430-like isoform X2 n=1 Tax=Malus domestica TaxID=3750 RepID=UPI0004991230|nr:uncharacterized protein At5g08430-like isoform X2 [Malus domestica]XP_050127606.1 uncharacterized protein At5g08430-like isoform X2 [Malus sylvestris]